MFNTTITVRPVPSSDQVVIGITPKSFVSLLVKTTFWSVAPVVVLVAGSELHELLKRKPKNTEVHIVK